MLNIALFVCNSYEENTMVINRKDSHDAIIIDPGCTEGEELDRVVSYIEKNGLKPAAILLTHAHPDHTAGVAALQGKYGIPVYMHPLERPKDSFRSTDIEDGQVLELAGIKLRSSARRDTPPEACAIWTARTRPCFPETRCSPGRLAGQTWKGATMTTSSFR